MIMKPTLRQIEEREIQDKQRKAEKGKAPD